MRPGSLSKHLVAFCRFLRASGFSVGPGEEVEMFRVLGQWEFDSKQDFQLILSQLLCKSRPQQLEFPQLFEDFWQQIFASFNARIKPKPERASRGKPAKPATLMELKDWLYNKRTLDNEDTAFYSSQVSSKGRDLTGYHSKNIEELTRILALLAKEWASRPSRRKVRTKSGGEVDLRRVIRRNLTAGEIIDISFRENKIQKPRLILVCDVSKSMEVFSNFTVQLLYAFQTRYRSIETFVFGTELYHITKLLKHYSFKKALEMLTERVPDWSGGTRIGHSLDLLIRDYGSRLLHGKVIFLMISDGWDTGEIDLLEDSLKYIKRRVKKLIWLNPLAGKPGYKPEVKGMVAALPYIDYMHGVHDVRSLVAEFRSGIRYKI